MEDYLLLYLGWMYKCFLSFVNFHTILYQLET